MTWKGTIPTNAELRFGEWLRWKRTAKFGWSVPEAAERLGVSTSTWRAWEAGYRVPRLPELLGIMALLQVEHVDFDEWRA